MVGTKVVAAGSTKPALEDHDGGHSPFEDLLDHHARAIPPRVSALPVAIFSSKAGRVLDVRDPGDEYGIRLSKRLLLSWLQARAGVCAFSRNQ